MLRKMLLSSMILCLPFLGRADENSSERSRRGSAAGYSSREATALSMMGWGFLLAAGIAAIAIFASSDDSSSSHTGHNH